MKGIVFTEFIEMVEAEFSPAVADRIITDAELPSGGVYTAVGTYDYREAVALVGALSRVSGQPVPDLLRAFGQYLLQRFVTLYPTFFERVDSTFAFLESVDRCIHVEVRKLYPDAETPQIETRVASPETLTLIYRSERGFHDLAEGLIRGCATHFGENLAIQKEDLSGGAGTCVQFTLSRALG